jgi:cobyric acid synthase
MNYYSDEEDFEKEDDENTIKNYEGKDPEEEKIEIAKDIYSRIKNYCDFHGLNFLNKNDNICISNMIDFIK